MNKANIKKAFVHCFRGLIHWSFYLLLTNCSCNINKDYLLRSNTFLLQTLTAHRAANEKLSCRWKQDFYLFNQLTKRFFEQKQLSRSIIYNQNKAADELSSTGYWIVGRITQQHGARVSRAVVKSTSVKKQKWFVKVRLAFFANSRVSVISITSNQWTM